MTTSPHTIPDQAELPPVRLLTPEQAQRSLNVGRTRLYELLRDGTLRSVTIGRSRRIPAKAIDDYVDLLCSTVGSRK